MSGLETVSIINRNTPDFTQLEVDCPAGKKVLGGGAEALGNASILNRTSPNASGTGWIAVGHQPGVGNLGLSVWAICAVVS